MVTTLVSFVTLSALMALVTVITANADKQCKQRRHNIKKGTEDTLLPFSQYLYRRMETVDTTTTKLSSWDRATPLACQILSASTWVWPVVGLYDNSRPSMSPCMTQSMTGMFQRVNLMQPFNADLQHMTWHLRPSTGDELRELLLACFWERLGDPQGQLQFSGLHAMLKADARSAASHPAFGHLDLDIARL